MQARGRWAVATVAALVLTVVVAPVDAQEASPRGTSRPSRSADLPVPLLEPDPVLARNLGAIVAASPADTCLVASVDGAPAYAHRVDDAQVPASILKLLTAGAVLDRIGPDARFRTRAVAGGAIEDGVLRGDLHLVGDGDPTLVARAERPGRPSTDLAGLADQLVAGGLRAVEGRVLGDGSRYDALTVVPSWPERYIAQGQVGPLAALVVDGGLVLEGDERQRSDDPVADAARAFAELLAERGVLVLGPPGAAVAPPGDALAEVASAPMADIVDDMVRRSDNHAAELLAKELGKVVFDEGTTALGALAVAEWAASRDLGGAALVVVDGSGLDPGNRLTCAQVQRLLEADGPDGAVARGFPVAGESGTLQGRFGSGSARGVLRAKTGSLNGVSSLAGHVALPDGGTATFTYIANADLVDAEARELQAFLAEVLASYRPPCPQGNRAALGAPQVASLVGIASLATGGAPMGALGAAATTGALQARGGSLVDRCSAADGERVLLRAWGR
jgi:D-alanyl-D-alanine carboxypeptidase/D-alanyl-D-alanine-endopeptidase (penicillin-binding protein 4)